MDPRSPRSGSRSPTSAEDAPLVTYTGSHLDTSIEWRTPWHGEGGLPLLPGYRDYSELAPYVAEKGFERQVWLASRGDVIVVNPYTVHASLAREAGGALRIGFSSRWLGDGVVWKGDIYYEPEAARIGLDLPVGSPPPDDLYPIVWRRP